MKQIIFLSLILGVLLISGCEETCDSGMYTGDGKCCTYVCNEDCENGYKEGTCGCECAVVSDVTDDAGEDSDVNVEDINLDDIFDDTEYIDPPSVPI